MSSVNYKWSKAR